MPRLFFVVIFFSNCWFLFFSFGFASPCFISLSLAAVDDMHFGFFGLFLFWGFFSFFYLEMGGRRGGGGSFFFLFFFKLEGALLFCTVA